MISSTHDIMALIYDVIFGFFISIKFEAVWLDLDNNYKFSYLLHFSLSKIDSRTKKSFAKLFNRCFEFKKSFWLKSGMYTQYIKCI